MKTLMTGSRIVLKSVYGYEIEKINVYQERFLVAKTPETLLMGDLETCKLSEIPWVNPAGGEKFHFENEQVTKKTVPSVFCFPCLVCMKTTVRCRWIWIMLISPAVCRFA